MNRKTIRLKHHGKRTHTEVEAHSSIRDTLSTHRTNWKTIRQQRQEHLTTQEITRPLAGSSRRDIKTHTELKGNGSIRDTISEHTTNWKTIRWRHQEYRNTQGPLLGSARGQRNTHIYTQYLYLVSILTAAPEVSEHTRNSLQHQGHQNTLEYHCSTRDIRTRQKLTVTPGTLEHTRNSPYHQGHQNTLESHRITRDIRTHQKLTISPEIHCSSRDIRTHRN